MGLFTLMARKPVTSFSPKSGLSSNHNRPTPIRADGRVTAYEFKHKIRPALTRAFGRSKGSEMRDILMGDMDRNRRGSGITEREKEVMLKNLRDNHSDNISNKEIDTLKGIIDAQL